MPKHRAKPIDPACYAVVLPGLEQIAKDELMTDFGADVKKTSREMVVFRRDALDAELLQLRTVEDVFLLAWGTDELTFRAKDLKSIEQWTARDVNWDHLLRIHHRIRPKPTGKPTFRLVTQMRGKHVYRRVDAGKAMAKGLVGKLPESWKHAEENAAVEIWLTIHGRTAVCGVRLSDRTMRHRRYKKEHMPASLRPTMAAAMVRLAAARRGEIVLDPMCGAGTILAEQLLYWGGGHNARIFGGDIQQESLRNSGANLRFGDVPLCRWDATRLPLADGAVNHIISNPPFGKQLAKDINLEAFYRNMIREYDRVLRSGGKAVLLVAEQAALKRAASEVKWQQGRTFSVKVLGQAATLSVSQKQ